MLDPKYSQWFTDRQPWVKGIYQRAMMTGDWYAYWDGSAWSVSQPTIKKAWACRKARSIFQGFYANWRGLAENPNG